MTKLPPRSEKWGLFVGLFVIYILLPTRRYYWDGIVFAQVIEDAPRLDATLFHQNHLLYNVFGYLLYKFAGLMGTPVRALHLLQVANILLSVLCAVIFFQILKSALNSRYLCYCLTLMFSFSATWWKFSTDADSYILTTLFLLISFYLLLPDGEPRPTLVAITHSMGMLFHQLAVLFFPVVLLGIYFQTSSLSRKQRLALMARYLIVAFTLTVSTYYLCFYLMRGDFNFQAFTHWLFSYRIPDYPTANFTLNFWFNLVATLRGHKRLFLDTSGILPWTISMKNPLMVILFAGLIAAVAVFFFKLAQDFYHSRIFSRADHRSTGKFKSLLTLSVAWCVCYITFLFFFRPEDTFHRLVYLPALILLLGITITRFLNPSGYRRRYKTALAVLIMASFNLIFLIFPYSRIRGNPTFDLALKMSSSWPQQTVVYYSAFNGDDELVKYFSRQATWRQLNPDALAIPESELRQIYTNGRTAWISTLTIDCFCSSSDGKTWLQDHTKEQFRFELVTDKYRVRYFQIFSADDTTNKLLKVSPGSADRSSWLCAAARPRELSR